MAALEACMRSASKTCICATHRNTQTTKAETLTCCVRSQVRNACVKLKIWGSVGLRIYIGVKELPNHAQIITCFGDLRIYIGVKVPRIGFVWQGFGNLWSYTGVKIGIKGDGDCVSVS